MSLFCCPSCGLPAEDIWHFVVESTDGPIEYYHACCVQMHRFTIPATTVAETIQTESTVPEPELDTELVLDLRDGLQLQDAIETPPEPATPAPATDARTGPPEPAEALAPSEAGLVHLPPPHTTVDTLWAPRTRLAAGAFFAGGLSSGFLLKVPVVLAFAIVLGLMAVAVIATLVPVALASRRLGRGQIRRLGQPAGGSAGSSNDEGQRAA
jgi:hypothetical protein